MNNMKFSLPSMSLQRYLFLLFACVVLLIGGAQLMFINYVQNQVNAEVEDKSSALSEQAVKLLFDALDDTQVSPQSPRPARPAVTIEISNTPGRQVDLGDGYVFQTGEETQTVRIRKSPTVTTHVLRDSLQGRVHQLNIAPMSSHYSFTVGFSGEDAVHQQIVQFNPKDSATSQYFRWLALATLVLCGAGLVLAYWLARHISQPLAGLSRGFAQLEQGELGSQVKVEGVQEVRKTLDRFNHMSGRLAHVNQLESQLQQQQQLLELGEVSRGLAHTLRNPLNTIGLALEQMAESQLDDDQKKQLAEQARAKINHLDNTIKALLSLTTSDVQRNTLVDVNEVVEDVVMELSMSGGHNLHFTRSATPSIQGARSEIRAMIHSLVCNALEACKQNQAIHLFVEQRDDTLQFQVCDEGPGLKQEIRENLFKPHVSSKSEGAGMGLYIARRLARSYYHGDITLTDNRPTGCVATLSLKLSQQQGAEHD